MEMLGKLLGPINKLSILSIILIIVIFTMITEPPPGWQFLAFTASNKPLSP